MKMLQGKRLIAGIVAALLMTGGTGLMVNTSDANAAEPVGPKLTPRLRQLLTEEMRSIKQATGEIYNGMIVGDHSVVANMAEQIHGSFILNRELTAQDKKDLTKALPPEFLKLDGDFHATAKKLMHAAEQKDSDLQRYYFGKMTESCQTCHSTYVTDRFPGFAGEAPAGHVH